MEATSSWLRMSLKVQRSPQTLAPIVLIDGECGFCIVASSFMKRRLRLGGVILPWQSFRPGSLGIDEVSLRREMWVIDGERRYGGSSAVAEWLRTGGVVTSAFGWLLSRPMVAPLARRIYSVVAANRHRIPGSWNHSCSV